MSFQRAQKETDLANQAESERQSVSPRNRTGMSESNRDGYHRKLQRCGTYPVNVSLSVLAA